MTSRKEPGSDRANTPQSVESDSKSFPGIVVHKAKKLPPAARRALAEAEARRKAAAAPDLPKEIHGPTGPEPTRYGDWENKGIASDF